MYTIFLTALFSILFQQETISISPDRKYKLTIRASEESDLQTRYNASLIDMGSNETIEIFNCLRRDLSSPNFYWDKDSKFLVFEQCSDSFKQSSIKILDLITKKTVFELNGLVGNNDKNQQQFDAINSVLIYFDTSNSQTGKVPDLYAFELKTKRKKKIHEFGINFYMEFPELSRMESTRKISITYYDSVSRQNIKKQIDY